MDDGNPDFCLGRGFYPSKHNHLTIIASDPAKNQERVLVVNISSQAAAAGDTGHTLTKGDHPGISRTSYIRCDYAEITSVAALQAHVKRCEARLTHCMVGAPLQTVHAALAASRRVSGDAKALLRAQGLIP
ncbi:MAG: hypothetical protein ACR2G6_05210 [Gemmatimonadaceae bacterium]